MLMLTSSLSLWMTNYYKKGWPGTPDPLLQFWALILSLSRVKLDMSTSTTKYSCLWWACAETHALAYFWCYCSIQTVETHQTDITERTAMCVESLSMRPEYLFITTPVCNSVSTYIVDFCRLLKSNLHWGLRQAIERGGIHRQRMFTKVRLADISGSLAAGIVSMTAAAHQCSYTISMLAYARRETWHACLTTIRTGLFPFWWTLANVESRRRHYFRDELYTNRSEAGIGRRGSAGSWNWGCPSRKAVWRDFCLASLLTGLYFY